MNYDLLLLLLFYLFLLLIFKLYRKKFEVQGKVFVLYKTKIGIKLMDKISSKFPKLLNALGYVSVFIGFLGMIITTIFIVYITMKFLFIPETESALAPILPGISVHSALPVLSFWHWIIAILFVATIHEFSHGVYARLKKIKIKSTGFAFLGPILAAFVEPDEKQLKKKPIKHQLFVFSAGPFSNIVSAVVIFLILIFVFTPIGSAMTEVKGLKVIEINKSLPINNSGIKENFLIQEIDNVKINDARVLNDIMEDKKPGDVVSVKANDSYYNLTLATSSIDANKPILGVTSVYETDLKESLQSYSWIYKIFSWLAMLTFWTFNISLGVGLFNLLPIGPVDGGRMFHALMLKITKNEKKATKLLTVISIIILGFILINLFPFIVRLFKFIFSPFF